MYTQQCEWIEERKPVYKNRLKVTFTNAYHNRLTILLHYTILYYTTTLAYAQGLAVAVVVVDDFFLKLGFV